MLCSSFVENFVRNPVEASARLQNSSPIAVLNMSAEDFPSGEWMGFYNYRPGDRHRMHLQLTFANGTINGIGNDDVGRFVIKGQYDPQTRECWWRKTYLGAHAVFYRGFREGRGIWGTWEITIRDHGGFHIWPRQPGEGEGIEMKEKDAEPVDAVSRIEVTTAASQA